MSTILKALRRLEQDKVAEADRSLQTAVVEPADAAAKRFGRVGWLLGGLLAAALGAGGVLLLQRGGAGKPAPAVSSGPAAQAPIAVAPVPLPAPVSSIAAALPAPLPAPPAMPPEAPAAVIAATEAPLGVAEPAPAPPPVAAAPVGAASPTVLPAPVAVEPPAPVAPFEVPSPAPALPQETPARVARLEPRASAPKAALPGRAAPAAEAGAIVAQPVTRGIDDSSAGEEVRSVEPVRRRTARVAAPVTAGVSVLRTIWHPKPERRTALLEVPGEAAPHEYREGERVGALTLLRIEPSGVVFERDGVEIPEKVGAKP